MWPTGDEHGAGIVPPSSSRRGEGCALGLAQVATLVVFLLVTILVVNALTPETVGAEATAAWHGALWNLGLLAVVVLVHAWLRAVEFSLSEKIGYEVVRRLRMQMYSHLQGMTPPSNSGTLPWGSTSPVHRRLVHAAHVDKSGTISAGWYLLLVLLGTLVALLILNPWMGLVIITVLAAGPASSLSSGKRTAMRSATRSMRRRRSLLTSGIDEQMNALLVVQVFGRSLGEYSRLTRQNDSLNRALFRVAELRGRLRGIASASGLLTVIAVLGVGLIEVRRGTASVGLVVASIVVTRQLNVPVRTLGLAHDYWHRFQGVATEEGA